MGVYSGRYAKVANVPSLSEWSIQDTQQLAEAIDSYTAFGVDRDQGIEDWAGSAMYYGEIPPYMPGDTIPFQGYTAPTSGVDGSAGLIYSGNALIAQLQAQWNWAAGEMLSHQLDFAGHLDLSVNPSVDIATDTVPPFHGIPAVTKFQYSVDGAAWTDWTDLVQGTLTIKNALATYVNSGTIVGGKTWTGRQKGAIDWELSVTEQNTDRTRFTKGQQLWFRLYTTATRFWLLKFGSVESFTGIVVSRKTGAIIQQTVNVKMKAVDKVTPFGLGSIILPNGTTWWPVAAP